VVFCVVTSVSEGIAASFFKADMNMEATAHFWALVTNHKTKWRRNIHLILTHPKPQI